jgi:hypothetical protein
LYCFTIVEIKPLEEKKGELHLHAWVGAKTGFAVSITVLKHQRLSFTIATFLGPVTKSVLKLLKVLH